MPPPAPTQCKTRPDHDGDTAKILGDFLRFKQAFGDPTFSLIDTDRIHQVAKLLSILRNLNCLDIDPQSPRLPRSPRILHRGGPGPGSALSARPQWGRTASGRDSSTIFLMDAGVSSRRYTLSAVIGSVMMVAGFELTR